MVLSSHWLLQVEVKTKLWEDKWNLMAQKCENGNGCFLFTDDLYVALEYSVGLHMKVWSRETSGIDFGQFLFSIFIFHVSWMRIASKVNNISPSELTLFSRLHFEFIRFRSEEFQFGQSKILS